MNPETTLRLQPSVNRANGGIEILQISDLHLLSKPGATLLGVDTEKSARRVIDLARSNHWPPDLILLTGDLTQEPQSSTYQRLFQMLCGLEVPAVCLPGNHDNPNIMRQELQSENVSCVSQILFDDWQIICLDSSVPGSEQGHFSDRTFNLLSGYLDRHPSKYALIGLHHHPLPIDCAWLDTMVLDNHDEFFSILESRPQIRAVVCGHIHQDFKATRQHIQFFGVPSTCFQFKPRSEKFVLDGIAPGYRHLSLYPDGTIKTEVYRLAGLPNGLDLSSAGY